MKIVLKFGGKSYSADLLKPIDISLPIRDGLQNPNCFYAPPVAFTPVRSGSFVGSRQEGGAVNFFNIKINPHGNGTHTECVGHISKEKFTIRDSLKCSHYIAKLISVVPRKQSNGDSVILKSQIETLIRKEEAPALIIRTMPNEEGKKHANYSGSNPPYFEPEAMRYIADSGVVHLLTDLPSVDREEDGGELASHHAFWQYPDKIRENCTITELIFVANFIQDGLYLLNLQTASFDLDVSPSKPILFNLTLL